MGQGEGTPIAQAFPHTATTRNQNCVALVNDALILSMRSREQVTQIVADLMVVRSGA